MGNTSTKEPEVPSSSRKMSEVPGWYQRDIPCHHPVSVSPSSRPPITTYSPSVTSTPTISKASSANASIRSAVNTPYPRSPNYTPSAPTLSPPVERSNSYRTRSDPFYFGFEVPTSLTVSSTESRHVNASSKAPAPSIRSTASSRPEVTRNNSTRNNTASSLSTAGLSVTKSSAVSQATISIVPMTTGTPGTSSMWTYSVTSPVVSTAKAGGTTSSVQPNASSTSQSRHHCKASKPVSSLPSALTKTRVQAPQLSIPLGFSVPPLMPTTSVLSQANSNMTGTSEFTAQRNGNRVHNPVHRPNPPVRLYTPINNSNPINLGGTDSTNANTKPSHLTSDSQSDNGGRGRTFYNRRARYQSGNSNNGDGNCNYQGNNGGRGRRGNSRGNFRGNFRGGFNGNSNHQNSTSTDNSGGEITVNQEPSRPNQAHFHQSTSGNDNRSENGESHQRGRGRGVNRGRGRGNQRRGNGRRNRGGGPGTEETHRDGESKGPSVSSSVTGNAEDTENNPYECPICMESLRPPIYQCHNGHMVCSECESQIRKCAICREDMPAKKIRNLPIEHVITGST